MSEELKEDARRKVTSVGNSWIVCKSRSHRGHVYYFNTLTGEAAWNLSDMEIEKAKSRTKRLETQLGGKPTSCPEPKDLPPSSIMNKAYPAHQPFPEPFVINTVSEQQSTVLTIPNSIAPFSCPPKQTSCVMQHTQFNNNSGTVDTIHKLNSINNIIKTFNLNTTAPVYNPDVWAVAPQTQQIFFSPTMTPLLNQTQASLNIAYNNLAQSSQPTLGLFSHGFDNTSQPENARGTKFYPRNHRNIQGRQQNFNNKFGLTNKNDLRQKISFKKRFSNASTGSSGGLSTMRVNLRKNYENDHSTMKEESHSNDAQHSLSLETQHEKPSRLDLGPLKSLAPSDCNQDTWFIVVDLDVLLNEFKFLNTLTDSDEQCHLMVPKHVMSQLKDYVTSTESVQARRILRFLSQQIEMGFAFMAEEPSNIEENSTAKVIIDICMELRKNNVHVILLSNDYELLNSKDSSAINIFSINEVKNLLNVNVDKHSVSTPKKQFVIDELINKIKIVVPNSQTSSDPHSMPKENPNEDQTDHEPIREPNLENSIREKSTVEKINESTNIKRTADAGIQTDFEDINASIKVPLVPEKSSKIDANTPNNFQNLIVNNTGAPDKKREIKLKRNISNQPPLSSKENTEKKQFRWRRRRNTQASDENTENKIESLPTLKLNRDTQKHTEKLLHNNHSASEQHENKVPDDSIASTESSFVELSNLRENVTIEETSTSGIISNSESNIDDESYNNISTLNPPLFSEEYDKPMYEIDSLTMEEYLKMKCDEWVSRFIQIMEEVLTQLLQQDPPFSHKAMPPPWTLHEAALCIAIKFSNIEEIKQAANKLSNILFQISDAKGKITTNLLPCQYMEMYSFGVHLLAAIKTAVNTSEDIQIAEDSLKKLLEDIKNPNTDNSTNDNFNYMLPDVTVNELSDVSVSEKHDSSALHENDNLSESPNSKQAYNLRSKKRKLDEHADEKTVEPVKFIRKIDIKSSFFSNLKLQRVNEVNQENASVNLQAELHKEQNSTDTQIEETEKQNSQDSSENIQNEANSIVPTIQQKVIRNFSLCSEFEEKLKKKYESNVYEDNEEELDYEEDYGTYISEQLCSEDENDNIQNNDANFSTSDAVLENNNISESLKSQKTADLDLMDENSNHKFKYMMCMLLQEIKKALGQMKILCDQCSEELRKSDPSSLQNCELNEMAKNAHLHITRLCRSLESMLNHEENHSDQQMQTLLKKADINICHVDESLLFEYRKTIFKCKEHADLFLNSIQIILSAFNK